MTAVRGAGRSRPRSGRRAGDSGTREAILDAARAQFASRGYHGATIRAIAAAAGVDPALVHHFYGTKEALFAAAMRLPLVPSEVIGAALARDAWAGAGDAGPADTGAGGVGGAGASAGVAGVAGAGGAGAGGDASGNSVGGAGDSGGASGADGARAGGAGAGGAGGVGGAGAEGAEAWGARAEGAGAGDLAGFGEHLVRTALSLWESPEVKETFLGLLRSAVTSEQAAVMLAEFIADTILATVARIAGLAEHGDAAEIEYRTAMVASQMVGLALTRLVFGLPSVANASVDDLAATIGPTIERYLTGDIRPSG